MYYNNMNKVIVHRFNLMFLIMSDVEDPKLFAAEPIYKWQQTEHGRWVMERCKDCVFFTNPSQDSRGYEIAIQAVFNDTDYMMYRLKWE